MSQEELLYIKIARSIEAQIHEGVLKLGDKLPSIRMVCRQHGVSMSTAQYAFHELETRDLVSARPQSGYYVTGSAKPKLKLPAASQPAFKAPVNTIGLVIERSLKNDNEKEFTLFSRGAPAAVHLPIAKLNKGMQQALRELPDSGTAYEPLQGNEKLRQQVAKWSFNWRGALRPSDIITTSGCITAIFYCLTALTKKGDTIAVESPCYFGVLQLARSMGLKVLELPAHPETGVDLDALEKHLSRTSIAACLLCSNFNNPLGSLMPDEHKQRAATMLAKYNVPLIEDDLYGDLYFGDKRPSCCKSFDKKGMVLLCSSVSKTLAPGYRVGWVAPGKFMEEVAKAKLLQGLSGTPLVQQTIGNFLENGRYEAHLRTLRRTLHGNYLQFVRGIGEYFPEGTKISRPQGGLSLWVELPGKADVAELYELAYRNRITFTPGSFFTLQKQFTHCMRLSYGLEWNEKAARGLKTLGKLISSTK